MSTHNSLSFEDICEMFSSEEIESIHRDLLDAVVLYMDEKRCSAKEAKSQTSLSVVLSEGTYLFAYNTDGILECFHHEKHEKVG